MPIFQADVFSLAGIQRYTVRPQKMAVEMRRLWWCWMRMREAVKDIQNRSPRDVTTLPSRETPSRERMTPYLCCRTIQKYQITSAISPH